VSLAPRLDLRQSQSLVMTPQLQQAIKLLALSNLEIEGVIAEELERNPLLDATSPAEDAPTAAGAATAETPRDEPAGADELVMAGAAAGESLDVDIAAERFDDGPSEAATERVGDIGSGSAASGSGEAIDFDSFADTSESLADVLLAQAGATFDDADLFVARALIDQIDEAGYLRADLNDIAQRLGVPLGRVEAVLAAIQRFDPTGVGARHLAECLAIQARDADRYDPMMARLLDHLDLLARGELARLKKICRADDEDMADMIRELRGYDPKPGFRYGGDAPAPVIPDLTVTRARGGWAIELNAATLPRVLVNKGYYAELAGSAQDRAGKTWLAEKLASANWLVKALDQRQRTIIKVASEIVRQQESFFLHGVAHLRPLTLRQVADAIELHESTVSRVTSNKYLSCARGLFELKYFFTSAIAAADGGDAVSAEAVKSAIRALIAGEGDTILSDDTLVELLNAKGFGIARRTVAKYREAMGIGSSVQRRRARALQRA